MYIVVNLTIFIMLMLAHILPYYIPIF